MKKFIIAAVAALLSQPAMASFIELTPASVGQSFTVDYNGYMDKGGAPIKGLEGQATFTLTGIKGNSYNFSYNVENTSGYPITASRISGFGFNTNPDIKSASSTGVFNSVGSGNVPSGFGSVDVCFKGGGGTKNCAGGGGAGVAKGDEASGTLTLNFGSAITSLTLSDFFVRYQSIYGKKMKDASGVGNGTVSSTGGSTSTGGTPVPEPSDLALFVLATAGLVYGRRKSRPAVA